MRRKIPSHQHLSRYVANCNHVVMNILLINTILKATLNWADPDDSGLSLIAEVQAKLKASGSTTPTEIEAPEAVEPIVNGANHVELSTTWRFVLKPSLSVMR